MYKYFSFFSAIALIANQPVHSTETQNFQYDTSGRLLLSTSTGTINNGFSVQYIIDDAGNRKRVLTTGSSNQGASGDGVIVVPLNGFTVIPIGQ